MLLQPFSKGFLGFFLMRAKGNLPIALLCNVSISNLTLLITVVIIVCPFLSVGVVVANTQLCLNHRMSPAIPTTGTQPFQISRDMHTRDNAESRVKLWELIWGIPLPSHTSQIPAGIPAENSLPNRCPGRCFVTSYEAGSKLNIAHFWGGRAANARESPSLPSYQALLP